MIIARPLSTFVRLRDPVVLCDVFLFASAGDPSAQLPLTHSYRLALPSAHRPFIRDNEHPCEGRRLSPTRLHPES